MKNGRSQPDSEGFSPGNLIFLPPQNQLSANTNWLRCCAPRSCVDLAAARGTFICFRSNLLEPRPCYYQHGKEKISKLITLPLLTLLRLLKGLVDRQRYCLSCFHFLLYRHRTPQSQHQSFPSKHKRERLLNGQHTQHILININKYHNCNTTYVTMVTTVNGRNEKQTMMMMMINDINGMLRRCFYRNSFTSS